MAIAYKSQGAGVVTEASGGALSPLCPATVDAGDILIAHCAYEGTTTAPSTPANWTLLAGPYTVESAYRHWIFGKIADGTEDGAAVAFGTPAVTTLRVARVYSFSGRVDGSITALVPAASFAHLSHATDPQMPTVTTTVVGALAVACTFQADDNPQASATGETGGDWVEAVAAYTQAATTPDTALHIQTCTPTANPGTVTGGSVSTLNDPCGVIGFEIKPTAAQTVSPGGITTAEAFGTAQLNLKIFPTAKATDEAFGTARVNQTISGAGNIAGAEAFGTAELTQGVGGQTISPSAIASAEALGTFQLNLKIYPSAKASDEAFGTASVNQRVAPSGIASEEALGTPAVHLKVSASSIASAEAFGTAQINLKLSPSGIASTETHGSPQVNLKVSPAAIASAEAFGTCSVSSGGIQATGIASEEAFGTASLNLKIAPSSVDPAEAFGTLKLNLLISPTGISSAEAFGATEVQLAPQTITAVAIDSAEAFGDPMIEITLPEGWWPVTRTLLDGSQVVVGINYPVEDVVPEPELLRRRNTIWRLRGDKLSIGYWDLERKGNVLDLQLTLEGGALVDLEDATVQLVLEDSAGVPTIRLPMTIFNRSQAIVRYHRRRGDIPKTVRATANREEAGEYLAGHVRVDWDNGTFLEWPLDRRLDVEIR